MGIILFLIVAGLIASCFAALISFVLRKIKGDICYRFFFLIGITWLVTGLFLYIIRGNIILFEIGLSFLIVGLGNQKKWRETRPNTNLAVIVLSFFLSAIIFWGVIPFRKEDITPEGETIDSYEFNVDKNKISYISFGTTLIKEIDLRTLKATTVADLADQCSKDSCSFYGNTGFFSYRVGGGVALTTPFVLARSNSDDLLVFLGKKMLSFKNGVIKEEVIFYDFLDIVKNWDPIYAGLTEENKKEINDFCSSTIQNAKEIQTLDDKVYIITGKDDSRVGFFADLCGKITSRDVKDILFQNKDTYIPESPKMRNFLEILGVFLSRNFSLISDVKNFLSIRESFHGGSFFGGGPSCFSIIRRVLKTTSYASSNCILIPASRNFIDKDGHVIVSFGGKLYRLR